ncbi:MAG: efflux RND transporter periplasmic adaptor subunit [Bacteroidia bacterium]|nr:efflux RND transporter periplasmic adaptor subunit [Bacteroidia bacterium]
MKRILFLLCLGSVFIYTGCHHENQEELEETKFSATSPRQMDTTIYHEYVAQIHSISHIELRSQEKGYLQNIYVDEGQLVKKGQLMFQIMPLIYQAEMGKAQAEAEFAEIEYLNTKRLADSNIVSANELALAKAHYNKVKAELSLAQAHLGFTEIHAPFDGIMGRFNVRLGSLVDEGELLTTLSDNSKMWVYFNVPESEYLEYTTRNKTNNHSIVKLKMANDQLFDQDGVIETIEADFNNETGNIAFRATFPNPNSILRHGETGNILMPVHLKNVLIIPQKSTFDILDKKYVYVIDKNNVVKAKQITIGDEMPHLYVVLEGLASTDRILLEGLSKVKNDEKIHYDYVDPKKVLGGLDDLHAE